MPPYHLRMIRIVLVPQPTSYLERAMRQEKVSLLPISRESISRNIVGPRLDIVMATEWTGTIRYEELWL